MYTFDLIRAEMLITHADSCLNGKIKVNNTVVGSSMGALAEKSLSEAQKLILNAKEVV